MQDRAKPYILTIPRRLSINSPKIVKDELDRMVSQGVQKISMLAWLWQGIYT